MTMPSLDRSSSRSASWRMERLEVRSGGIGKLLLKSDAMAQVPSRKSKKKVTIMCGLLLSKQVLDSSSKLRRKNRRKDCYSIPNADR